MVGVVGTMREWNTWDLQERIRKGMPGVKRAILRARRTRAVRRRPRNKEEQDILDLLCKRKWETDLARGRVRILGNREWYCEFNEAP